MCLGTGRYKRPKGNKIKVEPNGSYYSEKFRKNRDEAKRLQDKVDDCRENRKPMPKNMFKDRRFAFVSTPDPNAD